jgi:hAT family C-terminal dimerisation region
MHERIQRAYYGESALLDEIDSYLDSKPIRTPAINDISAQEDLQWVLKWWKANRFTYPRMAQIARDFIGIAAAEVGVERLFSARRDVIGLRRYSLQPATMKLLTMLKAFFNDNYFRGERSGEPDDEHKSDLDI